MIIELSAPQLYPYFKPLKQMSNSKVCFCLFSLLYSMFLLLLSKISKYQHMLILNIVAVVPSLPNILQ